MRLRLCSTVESERLSEDEHEDHADEELLLECVGADTRVADDADAHAGGEGREADGDAGGEMCEAGEGSVASGSDWGMSGEQEKKRNCCEKIQGRNAKAKR